MATVPLQLQQYVHTCTILADHKAFVLIILPPCTRALSYVHAAFARIDEYQVMVEEPTGSDKNAGLVCFV